MIKPIIFCIFLFIVSSISSFGDFLNFETLELNEDTMLATATYLTREGNLYTIGPNADLEGTRQSSITASNLGEGTYQMAVGRFDTRFRDGFSVERRPTGSDNFVLKIGTSQSIQGVIPEIGVGWFSFEVGPVILPDVAFKEVKLSGGNVIMSWQTTQGQRYRVQRSDDMKSWVNVGGLKQGTGNLLGYSRPASKVSEFFRVVIP